MPGPAVTEIYRLKEQFPKANATLIYNKLVSDGFILKKDVSLCTVQRFFRKNSLKNRPLQNTKDRKAFEAEFPCQMFQADTSHTIYITENGVKRKAYLIQAMDDFCRLIVGAEFFYEDNALNFQKVLKQGISRFGICTKLYVDNGGPYKNEQLSKICIEAGIVLLNTPVRDAQASGKVERSFKTIKESWLYGLDPSGISSIEELNKKLQNYVNTRNNTINRNIGTTPMERYRANVDRVKFPPSREWLDECFMNRVTRKVGNDSTVSIDKISYDVPIQFIGDKVEVRFLPDRMEDAYIFHGNSHYPIRRTDRVENSRTKRMTIDYSKKGG